jgi:hypothetical protein
VDAVAAGAEALFCEMGNAGTVVESGRGITEELAAAGAAGAAGAEPLELPQPRINATESGSMRRSIAGPPHTAHAGGAPIPRWRALPGRTTYAPRP